MKKPPFYVPIIILVALLFVSVIIIWQVAKSKSAVMSASSVFPLQLVDNISVQQASKTSCFAPLKPCTKQTDCGSCAESNLSCALVEKDVTFQINDPCAHGQLNPDGSCSGCSCDDEVCFSGAQCETVQIKQTGQYCVPSYIGKCDEYTSDTVLTPGGWHCACKPEVTGMFIQAVEGGNCNLQVGCSPTSTSSLVYNAASKSFDPTPVSPNRVVSSKDYFTTPCVYKTMQDGTAYENATFGPNLQRTQLPTRIIPDPNSDPRCHPILYSNRCTITTGGGIEQTIRGSGIGDDVLQQHVSPPFYKPVPPALNSCPDGWAGKGTNSNPCVDPSSTQKYAFYTENGRDWLGPNITSASELKTWWTLNGASKPWYGLAFGDVFCLESGTETDFASATNQKSVVCQTPVCDQAQGSMAQAWDGARDGSLRDSNLQSYGGKCSCDAPGQISTVDPLTCVLDTCPSSAFPNAAWNPATQKCDCGTGSSSVPFSNGLSFTHQTTQFPVCVKDPCNPMGRSANANTIACTSEQQCGGVCVEAQCYIPFGNKSCAQASDCTASVKGLSENEVKCVNGQCVSLDFNRAQLGSGCSEDAHCSLGACTWN